jgi:hypothetical protein
MSNLEVAMVHRLCPVCENRVEEASEVILNSKLSEHHAKKVKDMHNKNVGYSKSICSECKEGIGDGIYLVGIIEDKTENINNPYRSGHVLGITLEAFNRIFNIPAPKGQACWTADTVIKKLQSQIE